MFIIENLLFLESVIILASTARRKNNQWLFISAICLLLGGALYRFNTFLIGFSPGPGWTYFPAMPEIMITVGIVALELMGYLYFVKRYPVLPKVEHA
jgi:Ni/Fe-hydrogenase subunit HybB-like protein